jgi:phosphohistidine phosphatase
MIIYFLRHASAGQSKTNPALDAKRPLDKDGIEQSAQMGRALNALDVQVDAIVSSPLKRASQTASLVGNEIGFDSKLIFSPALQPDASFASFRDLIEKHAKQDAIMVVGHNPSLSRFLSLLLTGGVNDRLIDMKKGGVARVELSSRRPAELDWCLTPKLVRTIYDSSVTSSRPKTSRK